MGDRAAAGDLTDDTAALAGDEEFGDILDHNHGGDAVVNRTLCHFAGNAAKGDSNGLGLGISDADGACDVQITHCASKQGKQTDADILACNVYIHGVGDGMAVAVKFAGKRFAGKKRSQIVEHKVVHQNVAVGWHEQTGEIFGCVDAGPALGDLCFLRDGLKKTLIADGVLLRIGGKGGREELHREQKAQQQRDCAKQRFRERLFQSEHLQNANKKRKAR